MTTPEKAQSILNNAECLYSTTEVHQALDRMAQEITKVLQEKNPLILCVMRGALVTAGHLLTRLHFPLQVEYLHATRYQGQQRGGDLHWLVEPRIPLIDRTVLIIDDIMDGGLTLAAIMDYCHQAKVSAIYTAVLVSKNRQREPGVNFEPHFVGLKTEDRYLFGFGLDYDEYLRNVPGIYAVNDQDLI